MYVRNICTSLFALSAVITFGRIPSKLCQLDLIISLNLILIGPSGGMRPLKATRISFLPFGTGGSTALWLAKARDIWVSVNVTFSLWPSSCQWGGWLQISALLSSETLAWSTHWGLITKAFFPATLVRSYLPFSRLRLLSQSGGDLIFFIPY